MRTVFPACALATFGVLVYLLHITVSDPKPLRLKVDPLVSFAPAHLQIQIRLQPEDSDRWINVAMDNGDYRRSSGFTIEPDRKLYQVAWPGVPSGEYVIEAAVGAGSVTRATASQRVIVSGS